jgi:diacylglycerol kinase (CTP)
MSASQNFNSSFEQVLHKRSDLHILRKIWHITIGSLVLWLFLTSDRPQMFWATVVLGIAAAGFLLDITRRKNAALNSIFLKSMGPLMRRSEREGFTGLPFYALGCSLSLYFYQRDIAILSIMFLIYSDPISSFFGVLYGKDKILPNKSLQGAVAGFFTCYLISLFYLINTSTIGTHLLTFSIISGVIGAASELISAFNIDDNLTIPVVSGLGMTLLNHFIVIYA